LSEREIGGREEREMERKTEELRMRNRKRKI
jgi:hypothetical protein